MLDDSKAYKVSPRSYRTHYLRNFSFIVLWMFFASGTCTVLSAEEKPQSPAKPRVSLGVLVDASAHQKKVIEFQREVVHAVADGFANLTAEGFVVRYGEEVETLQDWSPIDAGFKSVSGRTELDVDSGKNQRTFLYQALNVGLQKLETRNSPNAKVLIVIGEGNNAGGGIKFSEIKKRAKAAHVQCFALLVADHNLMGGRVRHFGFYLYDLASATKGKAYDVGDSRKNMDKAIRDVLKRVR